MSFDAGAITGGIHFDISEFAHGMLEAESISHAFPAIVVEFLENPLSAVVDLAKEAGKSIFEAFEGTGHLFDDMGREALKAGMNVKTFSALVAAAKPDDLGVESLGNAIKFMSERAGAALQGDAGAIKAFRELGISMGELRDLMESPEEMLFRIADAFHDVETPALRVKYAMDLMSRAGVDMLPFLMKGSGEIRRLSAEMTALGGAVNEHEAEIGEKFAQLEGRISAAWTGVKKAFAEPILQAVAEHWDQINSALTKATTWLEGKIQPAMGKLVEWTLDIGGKIRGWTNTAIEKFPFWFKEAKDYVKELWKEFNQVKDLIEKVLPTAEKLADAFTKAGAAVDLAGILKKGIDKGFSAQNIVQGGLDLLTLNGGTGGGSGGGSSVARVSTGNVNITVQGANPKQIVQQVAKAQQDQQAELKRKLDQQAAEARKDNFRSMLQLSPNGPFSF